MKAMDSMMLSSFLFGIAVGGFIVNMIYQVFVRNELEKKGAKMKTNNHDHKFQIELDYEEAEFLFIVLAGTEGQIENEKHEKFVEKLQDSLEEYINT